jgi:hypothetical protein
LEELSELHDQNDIKVAFVFEEFVRNYAMALFRALEKKTDEEDT